MPSIAPFVLQTTGTTGTGDKTLQAATGFREAADVFGTGAGNSFPYYLRHASADEWEYGEAHMADASTLVVDRLDGSSNGGSAVNFSAGVKILTVDVDFRVYDNLSVFIPTTTAAITEVTFQPLKAGGSKGHALTLAGGDSDADGGDVFLQGGVGDNGKQGRAFVSGLEAHLQSGGFSRVQVDENGLGFHGAKPVAQDTGWGATNVATVRSFDADNTTTDEIADVLGTLIATLKTQGLLGG